MLMAGRFTSLISPFFANINMRRLSVTNKLIAKCMQILSLLPPLEGKSVIELGASIVHYAIELEKKVDNVLVMDFTEGAIKRNEETNGHFKNVKFMCVDVTSPDLKIKPGSVDVVF